MKLRQHKNLPQELGTAMYLAVLLLLGSALGLAPQVNAQVETEGNIEGNTNTNTSASEWATIKPRPSEGLRAGDRLRFKQRITRPGADYCSYRSNGNSYWLPAHEWRGDCPPQIVVTR